MSSLWNEALVFCDSSFPPFFLRFRSMYGFLLTVPISAGGRAELPTDACAASSTTTVDHAASLTPTGENKGIGINRTMNMGTSMSSLASNESWAKGIFDKRRQPAKLGGGKGSMFEAPTAADAARVSSAEAVPTLLPESGFVEPYGTGVVLKEQQPGACGVGAGFGSGQESRSSAVSIATGSYCSSSSDSSGPCEAGPAGSAAVATAVPPEIPSPPTAAKRADQDGLPPLPLPLLSSPSLLSTERNSAALEGEETGALELLDASEFEGANTAGLLDAVDALLGEAVLKGFGEKDSNEGDMLPICSRIFSDD